MKILLICEPRSGSNNFANWFLSSKLFTVIYEPYNPVSKWYDENFDFDTYKCQTKHICVKEIYYPEKKFDKLIQSADKIVCLYRENHKEQFESFLNSVLTNNWFEKYVYNTPKSILINEKKNYFDKLKTEFKQNFIETGSYFYISYEDLYKNGGIVKIIEYCDIQELKTTTWPIGEKYRVFTDNINRRLI